MYFSDGLLGSALSSAVLSIFCIYCWKHEWLDMGIATRVRVSFIFEEGAGNWCWRAISLNDNNHDMSLRSLCLLANIAQKMFLSMAWCKIAVSPLLTHWRYMYCSLVLKHRYGVEYICIFFSSSTRVNLLKTQLLCAVELQEQQAWKAASWKPLLCKKMKWCWKYFIVIRPCLYGVTHTVYGRWDKDVLWHKYWQPMSMHSFCNCVWSVKSPPGHVY